MKIETKLKMVYDADANPNAVTIGKGDYPMPYEIWARGVISYADDGNPCAWDGPWRKLEINDEVL